MLNGFILRADIVRKSTAENIWKAQAISKFDKDENSDAKEELWRICGESFLGRMVKRQGSGKSKSELDDICIALKKLSEDNSVPLFLGTSNMVSKTSIFYTDSNNIDNVTLTNRLKTLEESINSFMTFNSETKIAERTIISCVNTLTAESAITEAGHTTVGKKVNSGGPKVAEVYEPLWSNVVAKGNKIATPRQGLHENVQAEKTKTWRKQLNLLHDTAFCTNGVEGTLSTDIDLVAYGLAKHVTSIQFSKFLEEKGLDVCDCKLLTTFEGARTL